MVWLVDSLKDLALSISKYISQAVETLANLIIHPVLYIGVWISNIIKLIFNAIIGLINTIWNTFDILYTYITNILIAMIPNAWTTIILLGLTIVFLLRIYYFLKDVSILGNKI